MTSNPLAARRSTGYQPEGPPYGTQEWCDWRNSIMPRTDIEWMVGDSGCYLRDRPEWTHRHSEHIARTAEDERQRFIQRTDTGRFA